MSGISLGKKPCWCQRSDTSLKIQKSNISSSRFLNTSLQNMKQEGGYSGRRPHNDTSFGGYMVNLIVATMYYGDG